MNVNHARNTVEIKLIENDETKKIIADTHHQLKEAVGRGVDHAILEYRGSPGTMADAIKIQHQAGVELLEVFNNWAATFEALPSVMKENPMEESPEEQYPDARETIEKHKENVKWAEDFVQGIVEESPEEQYYASPGTIPEVDKKS